MNRKIWGTVLILSGVDHVARMGERIGVYRVLVGKPEGKRPLGRIILRWIFQKRNAGS
jgi:hypothetical protein